MELLSFFLALPLCARPVVVDPVAQLFSDFERGRSSSGYLDRLTGAWISAAACGALSDRESTEPSKIDSLSAGQSIGDGIQECVDRCLDLGARQVLSLRHQVHQVGFFHRSRCLLVSVTPKIATYPDCGRGEITRIVSYRE
jgi:hypothetical protein